MKYWLMKTEPGAYSWQDLESEGRTLWDGVRNYQARNNLREMRKGDRALIYHSVGPKEIVGIAEVVAEHYPDPTIDDDRWVVVDIVPHQELARPVTLAEIKAEPKLSEMALVKHTRLSVAPVTKADFDRVVRMGKSKAAKS